MHPRQTVGVQQWASNSGHPTVGLQLSPHGIARSRRCLFNRTSPAATGKQTGRQVFRRIPRSQHHMPSARQDKCPSPLCRSLTRLDPIIHPRAVALRYALYRTQTVQFRSPPARGNIRGRRFSEYPRRDRQVHDSGKRSIGRRPRKRS